MTIHYTYTEENTKKYIVKDAVNAAWSIMNERYSKRPLCMDSIYRRKLLMDTPITMRQLNEISDDLVVDSI